jgi:hypothetical protein
MGTGRANSSSLLWLTRWIGDMSLSEPCTGKLIGMPLPSRMVPEFECWLESILTTFLSLLPSSTYTSGCSVISGDESSTCCCRAGCLFSKGVAVDVTILFSSVFPLLTSLSLVLSWNELEAAWRASLF